MTQQTVKPRSVTHGSFTLERRFDAAPPRVFKAFSDPTIKKRWFGGPEEWGPDKHELDFCVGGRETSVGGPAGGPVHKYEAVHQDIVDNERIVITYDMWMDEAMISVSLATFEFKAEGNKTRLVMTEQDAFLDGYDDLGSREHGSGILLDQLEAEIKRQLATAEMGIA